MFTEHGQRKGPRNVTKKKKVINQQTQKQQLFKTEKERGAPEIYQN